MQPSRQRRLEVAVLDGGRLGAGACTQYGHTLSERCNALHGAALAAVTGEPLTAEGVIARCAEVALAIYSVLVFATLAGSLGAFFLREAPGTKTGPRAARTDEAAR